MFQSPLQLNPAPHAATQMRPARNIVDAPRVGVALLDAEGRLVRANQALYALLDRDADHLEGRRFDDVFETPTGDRPAGHHDDAQAVVRPDGGIRWVRISRVPLAHEFDVEAVELLSLEDVTARHQLEVDLQTGQRLEAMGRLAAGIAHEINTPIQFVGDNVSFLTDAIGSLLGVIDVLVDDLRDVGSNVPRADRVERVEALMREAELDYYREESPQAASQAQDGVGRIATIVRAMKALGHPDQGTMTPADLDQCLRDTVTVTRGSIKQVADVALELGGLPPVRCMPGSLSQVVMNLIVNAADAIREHTAGAAPGLITITSSVDGDEAVIIVADDGGGIPLAIQDRVFEPFFTTKDVGHGTGQGLALAYSVISEVHRGTLTFDTTPGVGTVFTIRLPLNGPGE